MNLKERIIEEVKFHPGFVLGIIAATVIGTVMVGTTLVGD